MMKDGQINSYASGSGALSVGRYKIYDGDRFTTAYDNITLDDVKKHRDSERPNWVIIENGPYFLLARKYKRLNENQLVHPDGTILTYRDLGEWSGTHYDLEVTIDHDVLGKNFKVKNWSILASMRFFLNNEEKVTNGI